MGRRGRRSRAYRHDIRTATHHRAVHVEAGPPAAAAGESASGGRVPVRHSGAARAGPAGSKSGRRGRGVVADAVTVPVLGRGGMRAGRPRSPRRACRKNGYGRDARSTRSTYGRRRPYHPIKVGTRSPKHPVDRGATPVLAVAAHNKVPLESLPDRGAAPACPQHDSTLEPGRSARRPSET